MEKEIEQIKDAIIELAECVESGTWIGVVSRIKDILYQIEKLD